MQNNPNHPHDFGSSGQAKDEFLYSFSREKLLSKLSKIENEFTIKWLEKHSLLKNHRVPQVWRAIKNSIETESVPSASDLLNLLILSDDILSCNTIPNYDAVIKPRLHDWKEYPHVEYEMLMAVQLKAKFERVEFVPRSQVSDKRTPDLVVFHENSPYYIECVRNKPVPLRRVEDDIDSSNAPLVNRMREVLDEFEGDWEIFLIFLRKSLKSEDLENLESQLRNLLSNRIKELFISETLDYAISVDKFSAMIPADISPEEGPILFIPKHLNPSWVEGQIYTDKEGRKCLTNKKRVGIYNLQSSKIKTVLNAIDRKFQRKQTLGSSPGIVFMDLDLSNLHHIEELLYVKVLSACLEIYFKMGHGDHIGMIGLTRETSLKPSPKESDEFIMRPRKGHFIRNSNCPLPSNFPISETCLD